MRYVIKVENDLQYRTIEALLLGRYKPYVRSMSQRRRFFSVEDPPATAIIAACEAGASVSEEHRYEMEPASIG